MATRCWCKIQSLGSFGAGCRWSSVAPKVQAKTCSVYEVIVFHLGFEWYGNLRPIVCRLWSVVRRTTGTRSAATAPDMGMPSQGAVSRFSRRHSLFLVTHSLQSVMRSLVALVSFACVVAAVPAKSPLLLNGEHDVQHVSHAGFDFD